MRETSMTDKALVMEGPRPRVICLCGSTRFKAEFQQANLDLTLAGFIVLSIGCDTKADDELKIGLKEKATLDVLHFRKIDLADSVLLICPQRHLGESTTREAMYAQSTSTPIWWWDGESEDASANMKTFDTAKGFAQVDLGHA